jgi:Flp pilus assembly protein TadD
MGTLARMDGHLEEAERWLRKAVALNPKNGEAASELHLLELRKRQR